MSTLTARTSVVPLFQGDDLDPLSDLLAAVEQAAIKAPRRLGDDTSVQEATRAYDDFVEEALTRAVKVTIGALPRKQWRDLVIANPPREDNEGDQARGFNRETMGDAVVYYVDAMKGARTVVKVDPEPDEGIAAFLDSLSDGDFSKLYSAAVQLNEGAGPDPKVRLSSRLAQTSDETSESPARLG
jgi:hypothetical protein